MALSDQSSVDHLESSDQLGPKTFEERDTNYNLLSQEHTSAVTSFKNIGVSSEKIKFSHNSRQADIEEDKLSDISDVDEYIVGKEESIANKTLNILTGIAQPHCSQTNSLNYLGEGEYCHTIDFYEDSEEEIKRKARILNKLEYLEYLEDPEGVEELLQDIATLVVANQILYEESQFQ
ncbi:uncharacterized protein SAPINGB_P005323 [Magnusiomyces paraingens]|uniref:Uncharacterized protein n=1 Tax=Magnusiomyces paraingens TaxID=2606893 RepID=A0A5E8BZF5_9ASCO|nr:uncharacterized protein SAPINGB_P005320 [Saprochaete ingens]XP_031855928.1 uncharacterized protein SAPINGB_P005323 [Saprochaete ingens]VVT56833.1 unnamed protein product [Saprochaete ingens]VVT56836.1 unnamed protein product [Saprochaete ingens]